jgi:hypothetical protein
MSLSERVRITPRFQRAVRIDSDLGKAEPLLGFQCTATFSRAITTICEHFGTTGQAAYTITGPFGSGKSSLLVAFGSALGPRGKAREIAQSALGSAVTKAITKNMPPGPRGWRVVPIIGARLPPASLVVDALEDAKLVRSRDDRRKHPNDANVLDTIKRVAQQPKHAGLVLVIDELGKALEYLAATGGDLQFFQNLAELASRSDGRLLVVGILHQAFDEYVGRAGRGVRDEWAKVQGRYLDIPLSVTGQEQTELLSKAINSERVPKRQTELAQTVNALLHRKLPDTSSAEAIHLRKCWPIHPVTACLLGAVSRRRFGQNQRSLFGFLNSYETAGFQDFLHSETDDALYTPDRLFDYLQSNLEPSILASPDGHRWALAAEALDRVQKRARTEHHVSIIKSIALLDLFRERSGLFGSLDVLDTLYPSLSRRQLVAVVSDLVTWSVITYRAHLSGYSLFAGSDFDVQAAIDDALTRIGALNLVDIRSLASLRPIVAKRHYHETGALRWFDIDVVALSDLARAIADFKPDGAMGVFLLVVPTVGETASEMKTRVKAAAAAAGRHIVLGQCKTAPRLLQLFQELNALEHIRKNRGELAGDGVARREVEARTAAVLAHLEGEVRGAFASTTWCWVEAEYEVVGLGGLTRLGSDLADAIYAHSPRIHNELLNRTKPSANAIAAQKYLLKAMVLHAATHRLGIDGFPAEGGLYEAILGKTGLHIAKGERSRFQAPAPHDAARLSALWRRTDEFLERAIREPVSATEVYHLWKEPPFGVRDGLEPVLFLAYLMTRLDRYTIYLQNQMEAELTDLTVDLLAQDPAHLTLRIYDPDARKRELFAAIRETVSTLLPKSSEINLEDVVGLARGLVALVRNQPAFSTRTLRLSKAAIAVRAAIRSANDPHLLLHETLPAALEQEVGRENPSLRELLGVLRASLTEIANVYGDTLHRFATTILRELGSEGSAAEFESLRERATRIRGLTGDFRLEAFVSRLAVYADTLTDIEGVASLAANKPPRDWSDNDVDRAELEGADLAQRFNRAEAFARVKGRQAGRHSVAFVVGLDRTPELASREFDINETERLDVLRLARQIRALTDEGRVREDVILAAIAHVGSDILSGNQGRQREAVATEQAATSS